MMLMLWRGSITDLVWNIGVQSDFWIDDQLVSYPAIWQVVNFGCYLMTL